jgi:hypothetical protein
LIKVMRLSILVLLGGLVAACGDDEPVILFDPEEIHVEILSPERSAETPGLLRIVGEGKRFRTLRELRAWMRGRSDPDRYPSKTMADGETPRPPVYIQDGTRHYPSRRLLVVSCDADTSFGWIRGLAAFVSRVEGAADAWADLCESPLLKAIRVQSRRGERWLDLPIRYPMAIEHFRPPSVLKLTPADSPSLSQGVRWSLVPDPWKEMELASVARRAGDAPGIGSLRFHDDDYPRRFVALLRSKAEEAWSGLDLEIHPDVPLAHVLAAEALVAEVGRTPYIVLEMDDPLTLLARLERGDLR